MCGCLLPADAPSQTSECPQMQTPIKVFILYCRNLLPSSNIWFFASNMALFTRKSHKSRHFTEFRKQNIAHFAQLIKYCFFEYEMKRGIPGKMIAGDPPFGFDDFVLPVGRCGGGVFPFSLRFRFSVCPFVLRFRLLCGSLRTFSCRNAAGPCQNRDCRRKSSSSSGGPA